MGREALDGVDVSWEAVGGLGDEHDQNLGAAEEPDCGHLFVAGANRSPAGEAPFGDFTQPIILCFEAVDRRDGVVGRPTQRLSPPRPSGPV